MEYVSLPAGDIESAADGRDASAATVRAYGIGRKRRRTFAYQEVEDAARKLMAAGSRPTVESVRKVVGRGSPAFIAADLKKFWTKQSAIQAGVPAALAFLPAEIADAARAQWEQALLLAQQAAKSDDNEARAQLAQLKREAELRALTVDLREKEWRQVISDQEQSLEQTRELLSELMKTLDRERELRYQQESRIAHLESQINGYRRQLATLFASAINKHQAGIEARKADKKRPLIKRSKPQRKR
jgi:Plasmid replication region DNA-binding N-term